MGEGRDDRSARRQGRGWEWTSFTFGRYPGFEAFPIAMDALGPDYRVLRGGSWATPRGAADFGNWTYPSAWQIFAGFRRAQDVT